MTLLEFLDSFVGCYERICIYVSKKKIFDGLKKDVVGSVFYYQLQYNVCGISVSSAHGYLIIQC